MLHLQGTSREYSFLDELHSEEYVQEVEVPKIDWVANVIEVEDVDENVVIRGMEVEITLNEEQIECGRDFGVEMKVPLKVEGENSVRGLVYLFSSSATLV